MIGDKVTKADYNVVGTMQPIVYSKAPFITERVDFTKYPLLQKYMDYNT